MAVVPGFAQGDDGESGDVAGAVSGSEWMCTEGVADGVDAPGDVVKHEDSHAAGPQECGQCRCHAAAAEHVAERERDGEREAAPEGEQPVDGHEVGVVEQIVGVALLGRGSVVEQPSDVRVGDALDTGTGTGRAHRRMGVAGAVAESVVAAMVGHPADRPAFEGHRSGDCQRDLERSGRSEAVMGQHAVEPDRDPESDADVHHHRDHHVAATHPVIPPMGDRERQGDGGEDHERQRDGPLDSPDRGGGPGSRSLDQGSCAHAGGQG